MLPLLYFLIETETFTLTEHDYKINKNEPYIINIDCEGGERFLIQEEFLEESETTLTSNESNIIVVANFKGGVGKSTTSDSLGYHLGDSVILNLDLSQPSAEINACYTVDYINLIDKYSINEVVKSLSEKYKNIIIDTPGENTNEVYEAIKLANKIVIPMTIGKRSRVKTQKTLETFFGEGTELSGDYKIYFFFNAYANKKKRDIAKEKFTEMYKEFKTDESVKIFSKLGTLDHSDAISTAEEEGKSIFALAKEKPNVYKSILSKMNILCTNIENHLICEEVWYEYRFGCKKRWWAANGPS